MITQYLSRNWAVKKSVHPLRLILSGLFSICFLFSLQASNINDGGLIQDNQTICWGSTPTLLRNGETPSGGDTSLDIEYLWMQAIPGTSFPGTGWRMVPNSNTPNYQPDALSESTAFIRCARRAGFTDYTGESNVIVITVLPAPNLAAVVPVSAIVGESISVEASFNPFASYSWDFDTDALPSTATGRVINQVSWSTTGTKKVTLTVVDQFNCSFEIQYFIEILNDPLPVELTFFRADTEQGRRVYLNWETASEENNKHFEIQHSMDGRNFKAIGVELGSGTTDLIQQYQYIDQFPSIGTNYYRLKQVDLDGAYEFSPVVSVNIDQAWEVVAVAYPNPFFNQFQIQLIEDTIEDLRVEVIDARGVRITSATWESGQSQQMIDMAPYSAGLYHISVHTKQRPIFSRTVMKSEQ